MCNGRNTSLLNEKDSSVFLKIFALAAYSKEGPKHCVGSSLYYLLQMLSHGSKNTASYRHPVTRLINS